MKKPTLNEEIQKIKKMMGITEGIHTSIDEDMMTPMSVARNLVDMLPNNYTEQNIKHQLTQYIENQGINKDVADKFINNQDWFKSVCDYIEELKTKTLNENNGMSIEDELIEFDIPNWALPALINGDESGLNDEDQAKLDAFVNDVVSKYGNAHFMLADEDELDLGFLHSNDIDNLGNDCSRLLIRPSKMNEELDEAGFQGEPNFQAPAIGGDGVLENEDEDEDGMDIELDLGMAAMSHLSDIQEEYPELRGRINFIKALIMDMDCKVKTTTEKLDALYDKYNN